MVLDASEYCIFMRYMETDPNISSMHIYRIPETETADSMFELEKRYAKESKYHKSLVYYALVFGHVRIINMLLDKVDFSYDNQFPIKKAVGDRYGNSEIVKLLLSKPEVDASVNNNTALRQAKAFRHYNPVQYDKIIELLENDKKVIRRKNFDG
ncbi:ankyrin repeat domain-containing protein [bacterium]|nr:ankyrin repeat domain-containing protein [bacterium]